MRLLCEQSAAIELLRPWQTQQGCLLIPSTVIAAALQAAEVAAAANVQSPIGTESMDRDRLETVCPGMTRFRLADGLSLSARNVHSGRPPRTLNGLKKSNTSGSGDCGHVGRSVSPTLTENTSHKVPWPFGSRRLGSNSRQKAVELGGSRLLLKEKKLSPRRTA